MVKFRDTLVVSNAGRLRLGLPGGTPVNVTPLNITGKQNRKILYAVLFTILLVFQDTETELILQWIQLNEETTAKRERGMVVWTYSKNRSIGRKIKVLRRKVWISCSNVTTLPAVFFSSSFRLFFLENLLFFSLLPHSSVSYIDLCIRARKVVGFDCIYYPITHVVPHYKYFNFHSSSVSDKSSCWLPSIILEMHHRTVING